MAPIFIHIDSKVIDVTKSTYFDLAEGHATIHFDNAQTVRISEVEADALLIAMCSLRGTGMVTHVAPMPTSSAATAAAPTSAGNRSPSRSRRSVPTTASD